MQQLRAQAVAQAIERVEVQAARKRQLEAQAGAQATERVEAQATEASPTEEGVVSDSEGDPLAKRRRPG